MEKRHADERLHLGAFHHHWNGSAVPKHMGKVYIVLHFAPIGDQSASA
jgi:hypothetical protein